MNTIEDRLRDELRTVADRVQPDSLRPLRPPPGRWRDRAIRWLAPVAAMAAVTGIITGVTVAVHPGTSPPPPAAGGPAPRFYVVLRSWAYMPPPGVRRTYPHGITAYVRSAATGKVLSSIVVRTWAGKYKPAAHARPTPYGLNSSISASANESVFALTVPGGEYLLHVAPDGRSLHLNPIALPDNSPMADATISPDGKSIAYNYQTCRPHEGCRYGIAVLSLTIGTIKVWLAPVNSTDGLFQPVFGRNGTEVMILYPDRFSLLDVAGPSGSLAADSRPIYTPLVDGYPTGMPTPDGRGLIITQEQNIARGNDRGTAVFRVVEVSARNGRRLEVLYSTDVRYSGIPFSQVGAQCNVISAGPDGLHFLVQCTGFGRLDGAKFTPLAGIPTVNLRNEGSFMTATSWAVAW